MGEPGSIESTPKDSSRCVNLFAQKCPGDLSTMKSAVFNENLVGARSCHNDSRQVKTRHIALPRLGIADWPPILALELNAHALQKTKVGMIPRHRKHKIILDHLCALGRAQRHCVLCDFRDFGIEECLDLAVLYAVFDVRLDPVLHVPMHPLVPMH